MDKPFALRAVGTLFDQRFELARELAIGLHAQFGPLLFDTFVRTSERLRECAAAGLPVQVLDPACSAAEDFDALAEEVAAWAERSTRLEESADERKRPADEAPFVSRSSPMFATHTGRVAERAPH